MSTLLELAERCETATGPDRHINLAIANAIFGDDLAPSGHSHNYTGSLDAAMQLVPEGWFVSIMHLFQGKEGYARLFRAETKDEPRATAATSALALCAAALRAIAHTTPPSIRER